MHEGTRMIPGPRNIGLSLILLAVPILEIALLFKLGQWLGFWTTLLLVMVSAAFGFYVIWSQGFNVMNRVFEAMSRGVAPVAPAIDGFFLLIAGILLIVPGILTTTTGLILLVPAARRRLAVLSVRTLMKNSPFQFEFQAWRRERKQSPWDDRRSTESSPRSARSGGPVIEGEFERIDDPPPSKSNSGGNRPTTPR